MEASGTTLVPTWPEFILATLHILERAGELQRRELIRRVAQEMDLSDEALQERLASGMTRFEQRMGWTLANLAKASWVDRPSRGNYRINDAGRRAMKLYEGGFDYSLAREVFKPYWPHTTKGTHGAEAQDPAPLKDSAVGNGEIVADPEEVIEDSIQRIDENLEAELLERLQEGHPDFFEKAVVDLLLSMGYGGAEKRGRRIGGPGDGGVDGVIDQDALGIDQIYVQAKRYATGNKVGRKEIQAFVGALQGRSATRGVFLTTSEFTDEAWQYAEAVQSRIILIDGSRFTSLMLKHRVGVQPKKTHTVLQVDADYFD
ncbi:restriction endonuclease [Nesterenkonia sp. K-15-9-6]|uniref:restriction endonuclease n=1 Tax=Nesterenkonia sp. K-15-9-6 TaxID=3093918 RepID=UPI0040441934